MGLGQSMMQRPHHTADFMEEETYDQNDSSVSKKKSTRMLSSSKQISGNACPQEVPAAGENPESKNGWRTLTQTCL